MAQEQLSQLEGVVESIVFHNAVSGWTVLELSAEDELVTVVGVLPEIHAGEQLRVAGRYTTHPSFGPQFQAEVVERALPASAAAILRYLSSGAVKGIGQATAKRLVERFHERTLEVMEKEPERLAEVRGITPQKARAIAADYARKFGVREAMVFLAAYQITPQEAMRAYQHWGAATTDRVRNNPYDLCLEHIGISFDRADEIARRMEVPIDHDDRIRAGILYVARHNLSNGHTCLPRSKLSAVAAGRLEVPGEQVDEIIDVMLGDGSLLPLTVGERSLVFLPHLFKAEQYIAGRVELMMDYTPPPVADLEAKIKTVSEEHHITYDQLQLEAIRAALTRGMLILTGGPGTGKTTTLNAIIALLEREGERVALAAPTGRAAKRMSDLTGRDAKTLHRLLEVEWSENERSVFARCEKNPLDVDAVIVDELSMVDALLFESLLRAMRLGCRLILVGDADQLPSVGPGNVLGDLITSGKMPFIELREIFRQAKESLIVLNAHRILQNENPITDRRDSDFFFMPRASAATVAETIAELCVTRLPAAYDLSPLSDIQVLCPSRKGELGSINMGVILQSLLNPPAPGKKEVSVGGLLLREGDKVMQVKNNYCIGWTRDDQSMGEGVFNGDIGILIQIDPASSALTIRFDDRVALYTFDDALQLELAYAITVHKSQGSEFAAVVMPMFPGPPQLCYRNLLYTAVTRAKSLLVMVGHRATMEAMVRNNRKTRRYTGLSIMLRGEG